MILAFKGWSPERHGRFSCRRDTPAPKKHDTTGAKRLEGLTVQASALKRKGCCSQRSRGGPPPDTDGRRRTLSLLPNNTEADAFRRLRVR
jgi:hypothetical protein